MKLFIENKKSTHDDTHATRRRLSGGFGVARSYRPWNDAPSTIRSCLIFTTTGLWTVWFSTCRLAGLLGCAAVCAGVVSIFLRFVLLSYHVP